MSTRVLPLELEQTIFELAALDSPSRIPVLLLVAWRVHHWLEPLLYRTILIAGGLSRTTVYPHLPFHALRASINGKDARYRKLAMHARSLFIPHYISLADREVLCKAFPHLMNLYTTNNETLHATVPHLKQLHAPPRVLQLHSPTVATNFASLTHLHLFVGNEEVPWSAGLTLQSNWAALQRLPSLSHLALRKDPGESARAAVLQSCTALQVLLIICGIWNTNMAPQSPWLEDPRLVFLVTPKDHNGPEMWQRDALSGFVDDWWEKAEEWVNKRKNGTVSVEKYMMSLTEE
ncbi:hypothetical protein HMN09_00471500 [Mycena chlorophos]|uniref:Uncharacterized protein n=1 Tax=Mycena chlorophos TaxID=658473 RepID=A0A8H6TEX1_MYCCL|nr:hypothetical protein HMN09_00471500 [Mycena chlorophos]